MKVVSPRSYSSVNSNISEELSFNNENYLFQLEYLSILVVEGKQAKSFLQGQLTCNLEEINIEQMRPAAQCNLKGRILALMDVLECNTERYLLVLPADLIEFTITSLKQVAMLSRVKIYQDNEWIIQGLKIENNAEFPHALITLPTQPFHVTRGDNYYCYNLGDQKYKLLLSNSLAQQLAESLNLKGSLAWHVLNLKEYNFEIYPCSRGLFLPHKVNLHNTQAISFNKGCYKGQEIIARMHYRGSKKHELQQKILPTTTTLEIGQKELNSQNQEVGQLIDYGPIDGDNLLTLWTERHPEQSEGSPNVKEIPR